MRAQVAKVLVQSGHAFRIIRFTGRKCEFLYPFSANRSALSRISVTNSGVAAST